MKPASKNARRLTLNRQTLRILTGTQLGAAAGGATTDTTRVVQTAISACKCQTTGCTQ